MNRKVAIWGIGNYFFYFMNQLFQRDRLYEFLQDVVILVDSDAKKWEQTYFDKHIVSPEKLAQFDFDTLAISTINNFDEIYEHVTNKYNVDSAKIVTLKQLIGSFEDKGYFADNLSYEQLKAIRLFQQSGPIKNERLASSRLLTNRADSLNFMPKNAIVAEVGVAYGDFSKLLIDKLTPKKFYAIDYFSKDDPYQSYFGMNHFIEDNMPHKEWYLNRFRNEISTGLMEVREGLSWDCLAEFDDDYFDYVYLDAAHDYESVTKDIDVLKRKVKNGGYIQFNDYTLFTVPGESYYGVVPAVNQFVNSEGHDVIFLCGYEVDNYDIVIRIVK